MRGDDGLGAGARSTATISPYEVGVASATAACRRRPTARRRRGPRRRGRGAARRRSAATAYRWVQPRSRTQNSTSPAVGERGSAPGVRRGPRHHVAVERRGQVGRRSRREVDGPAAGRRAPAGRPAQPTTISADPSGSRWRAGVAVGERDRARRAGVAGRRRCRRATEPQSASAPGRAANARWRRPVTRPGRRRASRPR